MSTINKKFLNEIINNLNKSSKEEPLHLNSRVLLVDSMNTFIRSFAMVNLMNPQGNHVGGITGYLYSIGYAIKLIKPTHVMCIFDGTGSTQNKKLLFPDYKGNRDHGNVLNWEVFSNDESKLKNKQDEEEAMRNQMARLIQYLHVLPVSMLSIPKIEADDVIGHLSNRLSQDGNKAFIMSADKDFYQLVNNDITVYSPIKKLLITPENVKTEFEVSAKNFLSYKVLMGDKSDNVPGIRGLGPKKILKLFPELASEEVFGLDKILEKSQKYKTHNSLYESIIVNKNQLDINVKLMDLIHPNIHSDDIVEIENVIDNIAHSYDKKEFLRMYNEDLMGNSIRNVDNWVDEVFGYLKAFKPKD
jgi:5'-3' exonuclease